MGGGGGGGVIKTENGRDRLHTAHAGQAGEARREWAFLEEDKKSVCGPPFAQKHRDCKMIRNDGCSASFKYNY